MLSQAQPKRPSRRRVPTLWLVVDQRIAPLLLQIAAHMPARSGIIVRPHALQQAGRMALLRRLRRIARSRRHMLLWCGARMPAGYDGRFGSSRRRDEWLLMPVHDLKEARTARTQAADAVIISPVHSTRTHPGSPVLGRQGFNRLSAGTQVPAIALGGMSAAAFAALRSPRAHGWAAIDGWDSWWRQRETRRQRKPIGRAQPQGG